MTKMTDSDPGWAERHIKLMRTQPGHWCFVPGCTGSQTLMWVPTAKEVRATKPPRGQAIDLPFVTPLLHVGMTRSDGATPMHIHWYREGHGDHLDYRAQWGHRQT